MANLRWIARLVGGHQSPHTSGICSFQCAIERNRRVVIGGTEYNLRAFIVVKRIRDAIRLGDVFVL